MSLVRTCSKGRDYVTAARSHIDPRVIFLGWRESMFLLFCPVNGSSALASRELIQLVLFQSPAPPPPHTHAHREQIRSLQSKHSGAATRVSQYFMLPDRARRRDSVTKKPLSHLNQTSNRMQQWWTAVATLQILMMLFYIYTYIWRNMETSFFWIISYFLETIFHILNHNIGIYCIIPSIVIHIAKFLLIHFTADVGMALWRINLSENTLVLSQTSAFRFPWAHKGKIQAFLVN